MANIFDSLWVEKYRPTKLDDLILTETNRSFFEKIKQEETIPRLLFAGPPGCGKTTATRIIINDILDCQYLYLNASNENGIDTIRNKVFNFAQTMSLDGKIKVVVLDEADFLSMEAQAILRNLMEDYSATTRFILTCNYPYKIIPALHSRCQDLDLTPPYEACIKRCVKILKAENVKVDEENKKKLCTLVSTYYPDLRRIINILQKSTINNVLNIIDGSNNTEFAETLFNKITKKENLVDIRKYVIENEINFNNDYHRLLKNLHDVVYKSSIDFNKKREILIHIGIAMLQHQQVLDKEINFFTMMLEISKVID